MAGCPSPSGHVAVAFLPQGPHSAGLLGGPVFTAPDGRFWRSPAQSDWTAHVGTPRPTRPHPEARVPAPVSGTQLWLPVLPCKHEAGASLGRLVSQTTGLWA